MIKAYKYRIYPTIRQAELLGQHFDACRLIWNLALEVKIYSYKTQHVSLNKYDLSSQLTDLKKEFVWLNNINAQSLQNVLNDIDLSFTNFYQNKTKYPVFKSKIKTKKSCKFRQYNRIVGSKLYVMKFSEGIKIQLDKRIPNGIIRNVVISKSSTNKYYASITYENKEELPKKKSVTDSTAVGIDVGLKHFVVLSDGNKIENPKYFRKSQERLKILQQKLAKKPYIKGVKSSNRRNKLKLKIAKAYEKITNQRKDFLHKLSNQITNDYDTICMEDLNIKGMMAKCKPKQDESDVYLPNGQSAKSGLSKSIGDAGWFMFGQFINYKSEWKGKNKLEIGRFEPSSRLCTCGVFNRDLKLSDREWDCKSCGRHHDRDILAANNIKDFALANYFRLSGQVLPVVDVKQKSMTDVMRQVKV